MNKNNNSFIVSHLQLHELKDYLNNFKEISYKVQENYLKYMDLYYASVFKNLSFKVQTDNNIVYCPLTLQKENIQKINFYTFPVEIFSKKEINKELNNFLVKYFTNLKKENNISNISFKIRKKNDKSITENDTINLNKTISEIFIDLKLSNFVKLSKRKKLEKDNWCTMVLYLRNNARNNTRGDHVDPNCQGAF